VTDHHDCLIVGGGLVGAACAYYLTAAGRRVLVVERGATPGAASVAAAGMLAPQIEARAGDPALPLALAARELYRELVPRLEAESGTPLGYHPDGIALVALDDTQRAELTAQVQAQCGMGLQAQWWDAATLRRRVPGIGPAALGAQFAPEDGSLDNVALVATLLARARERGAVVAADEARELLAAGGRVQGVRGGAASYQAATVVLAAGAWSARLAGLPRTLPVEPVRGQIVAVQRPPAWTGPVLFRHGGYAVPRGGEALLGSTMERVGFDAATTADGVRSIRAATTALLPALAEQPVVGTWAGLRPVTPDLRPIIGFDPDVTGLLYATGHSRNGILLGPITGEIIRDLVVHGETRWDLSPYAIQRFTQ
jgi:glycine oxidase